MRVLFVPVPITARLLAHTDGRPIAYTDATAVVVFVYQDRSGVFTVDIHTRHPAADGRLRVLLDERPLLIAAAARLAAAGSEGSRGH